MENKKVRWNGQTGVHILSVSPPINFKYVKTGDELEVNDEQAKQLLLNPSFELVESKLKKKKEKEVEVDG